MTRFWREGHFRSGRYGDTHWVEGHWVDRADWNRSSYAPAPPIIRPYRPRLTIESFLRPTKSSLCGAEVFFYQCPNGGRVFFDRPGWPWPKHRDSCPVAMHERTEAVRSRPSSAEAAPQIFPAIGELPWEVDEWILVRIDKIVREDAWYVLKFKTLKDETLVRALVADDPGDLIRLAATLSPWSAEGFAVLSYLDDYGDPHELAVCKYSEFSLSHPDELQFPSQFSKARP